MSTTLDIRRVSPHVAEVWLNRPDVRNAFNDSVIAELTAAFTTLGADADLRAIVLGGRGKAFCAGADLSWMRSMADYSWEQNHADAAGLAQMLWTVWSCPVPVVGRIQGDCYAGGLGLAIRIARQDDAVGGDLERHEVARRVPVLRQVRHGKGGGELGRRGDVQRRAESADQRIR